MMLILLDIQNIFLFHCANVFHGFKIASLYHYKRFLYCHCELCVKSHEWYHFYTMHLNVYTRLHSMYCAVYKPHDLLNPAERYGC